MVWLEAALEGYISHSVSEQILSRGGCNWEKPCNKHNLHVPKHLIHGLDLFSTSQHPSAYPDFANSENGIVTIITTTTTAHFIKELLT